MSRVISSLLAAHAAHLVPAEQLEARERRGRLPSGVAALDALIGGWPRGALSELSGGRSSGRTALLLASLAHALRGGETVGLIDVEGALYPRSAERVGVALGRLLWVRMSAPGGKPATAIGGKLATATGGKPAAAPGGK